MASSGPQLPPEPAADRSTVSGRLSERMANLPAAIRVDVPTKRRAGVFRRAVRAEITRMRDPRRLLLVVLMGVIAGVILAGLIARGEQAGADAQAYWGATRTWLNGGDPYHPARPFMPYVYSPWMLPIFIPWALLPWDVAWFVWRGATIIALCWSIHWAYKQRPMTTAMLLVLLAFPIAANLDTGNINLPLALLIFGAQFCGPVAAGLFWMVATTCKWVPALYWPFIAPRGRLWGIVWLSLAAILTALTLPQTIVQLQVLFGFPRPPRIDYFVFIWGIVPWSWRHPDMFRWLMPSTWPGAAQAGAAAARLTRLRWKRNPGRTREWLGRAASTRVRAFLGLEAQEPTSGPR